MSETQQRSLSDRIRSDFTTEAWVLIPIGVGINIVVGSIVQTLRLPLFLDTIGTMLVAILAGPWVAAIAGILTNVVLGFTVGPQLIPFALVNVAIALVIGYLAQHGWFRIDRTIGYWRLVAAGILLGIVNTLVSTPIAVLLFGGLSGSGQDIITTAFLAVGFPIWSAVFITSLLVGGVIDKTASIIIAYSVARSVPSRYLPNKGREALTHESQGQSQETLTHDPKGESSSQSTIPHKDEDAFNLISSPSASRHSIDPDALLASSQGASNSVIGYQPGDSLLHRLNPVTKLVLTIGLTVIAFVLPGYRGPLALLAGVIVAAAVAGVARSVLRVGVAIGTPLAVILLVVQGLFYPGNETALVSASVPLFGTVTIWREGVLFALAVVSQLLVAILAMLVTIATSHPRKLTVALIEKGLPRKLAYVFMSALQFVPRIRDRSQGIIDAQRARGLDTHGSLRRRVRALGELLSPLLIGELVAAQTRGLALEARGFNRPEDPTNLYTVPDGIADRVLRWGTLVAIVVVLLGVLLGWR